MRLKDSYFYTIKDDIKDEEVLSSKLLTKAGMIKKSSSGAYSYLPLGYEVLNNIIKIIDEELNEISCYKCLLSSISTSESLDEFKEFYDNIDDYFSLVDRNNKNLLLQYKSDEFFINVGKNNIKSYKDLPFSIYQIKNKYKDENKVRYGLINQREFLVKEAFSFGKDDRDLDNIYNMMLNSYKKIFTRLGIKYKIVLSGSGSYDLKKEEFHVFSEYNEADLVICDSCGYAAKMKVAACKENKLKNDSEIKLRELVMTKDITSIDLLTKFLNVEKNNVVKTIIYKSDDKFYAALVDANSEVSEYKLKKALNLNNIFLASSLEVEQLTKSKIGFIGPIGLNIPIIVDKNVFNMKNFVVGANKNDYHYINVNLEDFNYIKVDDIRTINKNDLCPVCDKKLSFFKSYEIANIKKLSDKYSEIFNIKYLDNNNLEKYVKIGSYVISIARVLSSIVENNCDENGIIWPLEVAPYKVSIVVVNTLDSKQMDTANYLYNEFNKNNIKTILDDRLDRAGVKFNDMELIGIPIIITVGNKINDSLVEIRVRKTNNIIEISAYDALDKVIDIMDV